MAIRSVAAALLGSSLLVSCAHYPVNVPLAHYDREYGYRFSSIPATANEDETFVILAFSGGGTRAASLAYGVLKHLANTRIDGGRRTLLEEVDVISSVSGGSFTAAFYVLNGVAELPRFEKHFLRQNVEADLLRAVVFNPYNWWRLLSPRFSRIDLAAEYYDRKLFDGRTYQHLLARKRRPYLVVNASEMDLGARFEFTQEQLNPICSDLQQITIGRAVAASSAFPILLSPITLRNYAGTCSYEEPEWVSGALDFAENARRYRSALELRAYMAEDRRYVHLMDGGIADNIGLRGMLHALSSSDGELSVLELVGRKQVKRIVVITVNAKAEDALRLDRRESTPGLVDVLLTVSTAPMGNYSFETVELLRNKIEEEWNRPARALQDCQQALRNACPGAQLGDGELTPVEFYAIEVTFASLDAAERKIFNEIGTNYSLTDEQVTRLIELGPRLLEASPVFRELVERLK